jgi:P450-derived glycosyltransferase activator
MIDIKGYAVRAATYALAATGDQIAKLYQETRDPWPVYEKIRERGPVYRSRLGYSAVTSHELCAKVLRDPVFGIRDSKGTLPPGQELPIGTEPSLLELDPPDHGRLRKLVAPAFRPKLLADYRPRIERTAQRLLDQIDMSGRFDLIADFAAPLPITVISELLGIPEDRRGEFARYGALTGQALDGRLNPRQAEELRRAIAALDSLFTELMELRRVDPGDDVISVLVNAVDGERITAGELLATCQLLLIAGFETTVNLIGNGVHRLGRHPDQWDMLRADPNLAGAVVEEVLRFDPPVPMTGRVSQQDTTLGGQRVRADTLVLTILAAANRDPAVYPDGHRFDITRKGGPEHFAFSSGIHYCLGAQLARIEGEVAFRALSERLPRIRPAGIPQQRPSASIRGFLELPLAA